MQELLTESDDSTLILRDSGGYVWVSSGYTRSGVHLTLTPGPHDVGTALSLRPGKRLQAYGPFTVVFDSRDQTDEGDDK
jgi:hypothetical protein